MRLPLRPLIVSALLAISAVYAWLYFLGHHRGVDGIGRFSGAFALLAVLSQILFFSMWAHAWRRLLTRGAVAKVTWTEAISHIAAGGLAKYLPGKVWGPAARIALLRDAGESWSNSFVSLFLEQYLVVHSAIIVCSVAFAAVTGSLESTVIAAISIVTAPLGIDMLRFGKSVVSRYHHIGIVRRVAGALEDFSMPRIRYTGVLLNYTVVWFLNGSVMVLLYATFFQRVNDFDLFAAMLLANTAGIVLGFAAIFAPGGLGVREGVIGLMLAPYIGGKNAVALAIVARLWNVAFELAVSVVLIRLVRRRSRGG